MTRLEAVNLTKALLGGGTNVADADLANLVDLSVKAIVSALHSDRVPELIATSTTGSYVAGSGEEPNHVAIPSDWVKGTAISVRVKLNGGTYYSAAKEMPRHMFESMADGNKNQYIDADAEPMFLHDGTRVFFTPDDADSVEITYIQQPADLGSDGAEIALPLDLQSLVIPYMAYWCRTADGVYEEAQRHYQTYIGGLQMYIGQPMMGAIPLQQGAGR